jgi:hypothetical protein
MCNRHCRGMLSGCAFATALLCAVSESTPSSLGGHASGPQIHFIRPLVLSCVLTIEHLPQGSRAWGAHVAVVANTDWGASCILGVRHARPSPTQSCGWCGGKASYQCALPPQWCAPAEAALLRFDLLHLRGQSAAGPALLGRHAAGPGPPSWPSMVRATPTHRVQGETHKELVQAMKPCNKVAAPGGCVHELGVCAVTLTEAALYGASHPAHGKTRVLLIAW